MPLTVHLLEAPDPEFLAMLEPLLTSDIRLSYGLTIQNASDVEILVVGVPEQSHIEASPKLHTVIIPWAGLSRGARQVLLQFPHLAVHNLHHNAVPVAESAMALMLAAAKRLLPHDQTFRRNDWRPRYAKPEMLLLEGKTALILGYGAIGRRIGAACRGLGMHVKAIRQSGAADPKGIAEIHQVADLQRLLPEAHVLFITAPLTPATKGMIGADELGLLPHGAVLVNVSRGPVVDERALYEALKSGNIRAGLDVWYRYPDSEASRASTPPSEFPFGELETVVMTPHMAEHTTETEKLRAQALADSLNAAARGEPLTDRVDVERGY